MSSNFFRIDGWPVARGTARAFLTRLKPAFEKAFPGITLHVSSGFRSYEDQKKIFLERYRVQWVGKGPYRDVRWWKGVRYVRHSGSGTVAQPGTSNHATGTAIDIYDSGKDAGVTKFGTVRNKWMQNNAGKYGFSNREGNAVGEAWHKNATVSAWEGAPIPREISPTDPGMTRAELLGGTASIGDEDMAVTDDDLLKIRNAIWNEHEFQAYMADKDWGFPAESAGMRLRRVTDRAGRSLTIDRENRAELAALTAAVEALAKANGADPAAILKAVRDGVSKAMDGLTLTIDAG